MANGIRTDDPRGFNKGRTSKFREGSRVRQTPQECRRIYRPKRYGNNHKDEDNSLKIFNDKNHQALSQKFRQHIYIYMRIIVLFLERFSHQRCLMVFHWSLSDNKSPQVSRTLLSILADLKNAVVWMVPTSPPILVSILWWLYQEHQLQLV